MDFLVIAFVVAGTAALVRQLNRNARRNQSDVVDPRRATGPDRDGERVLHDLQAIGGRRSAPWPRPHARRASDEHDWITSA